MQTRRPDPAPTERKGSMTVEDPDNLLVRRLVDRMLEDRYSVAAREVEQLIEATYQVIASSGSIDPPVRDILRAANLSTPAFYRHFRSKDELHLLVWDRGCRILAAYLERRMARTTDPVAQIRTWIEGVMRQAADPQTSDRTRPFTVGSAAMALKFPTECADSLAVLIDPLTRAVLAGVAEGRCSSPDPERDVRVIYDYVFAHLRTVLIYPALSTKQTTDHLVDFAFRALRIT
jgi:AcrR family transcriptional regulator